MIRFTRRELIRHLAALSAWVPASVLLAAPTGTGEADQELRVLGAFLDTLLPADTTPGATQLEIDKAIIGRTRANKSLQRLLTLGCAWLDSQARTQGSGEFTGLPQTGRDAIASAAEKSPVGSLPRVFFEQFRGLGFYEYYARPETWPGMVYAGPPQPRGFPDFTQPPGADKS
jgi:hypothetical protein